MAPPTLEDLYPCVWNAYEESGFGEAVHLSKPRAPVMLSDIARELGMGRGSAVLDAGCGRANHSAILAETCGVTVVGLDPVRNCLSAGQAGHPRCAEPTSRLPPRMPSRQGGVALLQGRLESMPFHDAAFDLIWSRTVLVHVHDLAGGLAECARVLKPGGVMLVETSVATGLMEPREAATLYRRLAIHAASMSRRRLERAFQQARFEVHSSVSMGGETLEYFEHGDKLCSKTLMRLTALLRAPRDFVSCVGPVRYEVTLASHQWVIYHLLGKLETVVYSLRRSA